MLIPRLVLLSIFCLLVSLSSAQIIDTISYSLGANMGQRLAKQGAGNLDYDSFIRGFKAAMEAEALLLTQDEMDRINYEYYQSQKNKLYTKHKEEGQAFLIQNAERPEVITTESGLQYEILTPTEGEKPKATSTVTIHYTGQLLDGTIFDSSVQKNKPLVYPLNQLIQGWIEGVQLMSVGSKYRFYIPQELAYGSRGAGGSIPPYATLIFDIELLSFK